MSDEKEFGLTNVGTDGVVPVQVEKKDLTILAEEAKKLQDKILANQGRFATESVIPVVKKKRGRPAKRSLTPIQGAVEVAPVEEVEEKKEKQWHCSQCQEDIDDKNVMKIGAGTNRWAVFCPMCQRSFGFQDQDLQDKVAALIRDNPTGKSAKA